MVLCIIDPQICENKRFYLQNQSLYWCYKGPTTNHQFLYVRIWEAVRQLTEFVSVLHSNLSPAVDTVMTVTTFRAQAQTDKRTDRKDIQLRAETEQKTIKALWKEEQQIETAAKQTKQRGENVCKLIEKHFWVFKLSWILLLVKFDLLYYQFKSVSEKQRFHN